MNKQSCAEAEELLGSYALDALPEDEAQRMAEHLSGCHEHAAAVAELRTTQALLALTAGEEDPPAGLRQRVLQTLAAGPLPPAREPRAISKPALPGSPVRRGPRLRWTPRRAYLAVAAAALLSLGIGGLIGYQVSLSQQPVVYRFAGDASRAPGAEASLVYFKDRQQAVLLVNGLPRLTAGRVYELWLIKGGVPVDEGISADPNGTVAARLSADVSKFDQFAITVEPGEQPLPTTTPILIGTLRARGA